MKLRHWLKYGLPLLLLVGLLILLIFVQEWVEKPREFRGTFQHVDGRIEGEGGPATLVTSDGEYDLFFGRRHRTDTNLAAWDGKRVIVLGHSRVAHGTWRKRYRAIDVIRISLE